MLLFWYTRQELCIKWGAEMLSYYTILTEHVREEFHLHSYLLYTWMISELRNLFNIIHLCYGSLCYKRYKRKVDNAVDM